MTIKTVSRLSAKISWLLSHLNRVYRSVTCWVCCVFWAFGVKNPMSVIYYTTYSCFKILPMGSSAAAVATSSSFKSLFTSNNFNFGFVFGAALGIVGGSCSSLLNLLRNSFLKPLILSYSLLSFRKGPACDMRSSVLSCICLLKFFFANSSL